MDVRRGALEEEAMERSKKNELQASASGCFDCNICLEFATEPVVTICGHLFCWPCMYMWLQQAGGAAEQQCPVCKAALSKDTLVPLYGRGHYGADRKSHQGLHIPRRPSPVRRSPGAEQGQRPEIQLRERFDGNPRWDHVTPSSTRVIHTTAGGVLGGMAVAVLPRAFRDREWARIQFSSPYYYMVGSGSSPRLRRQEMEVERLLHQIWVFLCFCVILCLLFF